MSTTSPGEGQLASLGYINIVVYKHHWRLLSLSRNSVTRAPTRDPEYPTSATYALLLFVYATLPSRRLGVLP